MGEGYGGLKLWTPGFMRNLYGRSSSYGRWSADVLGTLMPPGLYSVPGERSAVNGRVAAMGSPTPELVQICMTSVCEREPCAHVHSLQPVQRRRFCNSDAQVCTDMLEHSPDRSAALVEAPMPGPYTDVPGRIPSACIRVC